MRVPAAAAAAFLVCLLLCACIVMCRNVPSTTIGSKCSRISRANSLCSSFYRRNCRSSGRTSLQPVIEQRTNKQSSYGADVGVGGRGGTATDIGAATAQRHHTRASLRLIRSLVNNESLDVVAPYFECLGVNCDVNRIGIRWFLDFLSFANVNQWEDK